MSLKIRKPTPEQYMALMLCAVYGFNLFMLTFNALMRNIVGNTYYLDMLFVYFLYILILVHTILPCLRELRLQYIILLLGLPLITFFTCSNNDVLKTIMSNYFPYAILAFMCGASIYDFDIAWQILRKYAWFSIVMMLLDTILFDVIGDHTLGYSALLPALVFIIDMIYERKYNIMSILGLIISCLLLVQSDTAGAITALLISTLVTIITRIEKFTPLKVIGLTLFAAIIVVLYNNLSYIVTFMSSMLSSSGINVKVLNEVATSGISMDRFRESIFQYCFTYSKSHIFWGTGIGNDRVLITQNTLVHDQSLVGNYPHNLFLEFTMQFGLIIGIIVSLVLIIKLVKLFVKEIDRDAKKLLLVLVGMGFWPLMFSSSYIENPSFFLLLGFLTTRLRNLQFNNYLDESLYEEQEIIR